MQSIGSDEFFSADGSEMQSAEAECSAVEEDQFLSPEEPQDHAGGVFAEDELGDQPAIEEGMEDFTGQDGDLGEEVPPGEEVPLGEEEAYGEEIPAENMDCAEEDAYGHEEIEQPMGEEDPEAPQDEGVGYEAPGDDDFGVEDSAPTNADDAEVELDESDEDEGLCDDAEVQDHLKDSVKGSLRLKRLLSQDEDAAEQPANKRQKKDVSAKRQEFDAKVRMLLLRFASAQDVVMKHVLDQCTMEELEQLTASKFVPNKFDQRKTAAELLAQHLVQQKERSIGGSSRTDVVSAFKLRWKMGFDADKLLRPLNHRQLHYVISNFDGTSALAEVVEEASSYVPEEDTTATAMPFKDGIKVLSRFNRLELIDPMADCAVFGDANLTFSMNLAKHRRDLGHVGRVIATTFEELDTLRERYKEIDQNIEFLENHQAEVYHGVDCTRIAIDPRLHDLEGKLGAVYYNFPHSGAITGFFDSNPVVNWRHENLMRLFFRALRSFVKPGGVVKVSSNSGAVGVRYSFIIGSAVENEFVHVETMPFLEWSLHRYGRSYGDKRDLTKRPDAKNNQSYNAQNAAADMVYCFRYEPSGNPLPQQKIRLPPTLRTLKTVKDGGFKHFIPGSAQHDRLAKELRQRFLTEVSGIHVG